ncbi:glutamate racemase [Blattabacterium cuenoti]|uniref:glutamate racemase n=1 Tax=Blattabacterium cuenoti TaxID=1653831 RepID=UPI00163CEB46|nr:glutamate racemase [Blattabacterium cuenoti]
MKINSLSPIGIFDSGIGGLIIAKEIKIQMPNEYFIYFGDTINMPYGDKSKNFIIDHSMKIVSFLYKKKCKALVIACNSIASNALDVIKEKFHKKILIFNVIDPVIKNNIFLSSKRIGIIATPATIRSNFYIEKIKKYYHHLDIIKISTSLLAPIIEKGDNIEKINNVIKYYLNFLQLKSIDRLLLACTHYLFFKQEIENFFHGKVHLIDIQKIVVQEIKKQLNKKKLLCIYPNYNKIPIFYTSSYIPSFFEKKVRTLFGKNVFIKTHSFNWI